MRSRQDDDGDYVVVRRGVHRYRIPVDENGRVPDWALVARFQEVGDWSDLEGRSEVTVPSGRTPEEIVDWWANPGVYDIQGIDTPDSPYRDVSSVPKGQRAVQRKIAVIADAEEQARIRKILTESFTTDELETMTRNGSFVIRTVPNMGDATGCYYRKQNGVEIPYIVIERHTTPDGVVHEIVHHVRAVDPDRRGILRTAYPSTRRGRLKDWTFDHLPKSRQDRILEEEERMTVAETVVRTGLDPSQSGYYDGVRGMDPRTAYKDDRYILTDTPPDVPQSEVPRLKGRAARNAVLHGYEYTNIARSEILNRNVRKRRRLPWPVLDSMPRAWGDSVPEDRCDRHAYGNRDDDRSYKPAEQGPGGSAPGPGQDKEGACEGQPEEAQAQPQDSQGQGHQGRPRQRMDRGRHPPQREGPAHRHRPQGRMQRAPCEHEPVPRSQAQLEAPGLRGRGGHYGRRHPRLRRLPQARGPQARPAHLPPELRRGRGRRQLPGEGQQSRRGRMERRTRREHHLGDGGADRRTHR